MFAFSAPTFTTSVATIALTAPLPNTICTTGRLLGCWTFSCEAFRPLKLKVEDLFVPRKQRSFSSQAPFSWQTQEGTITESLPVSATTENFCPGVPTSISTVKCDPLFASGAQVLPA